MQTEKKKKTHYSPQNPFQTTLRFPALILWSFLPLLSMILGPAFHLILKTTQIEKPQHQN